MFIQEEVKNIEARSQETEAVAWMNRPLELAEVKVVIQKMKEGKATGLDGVTIEMLEKSATRLCGRFLIMCG